MTRHAPLRAPLQAPLAYRLAIGLLSPVVFAHLAWKAWRDGGPSYFRERLGFTKPVDARRWIHCASVGEVQTVLPLLDALQEREQGKVLVTTNTPTGKALLASRAGASVEHRYLPLDFSAAVNRFLRRCKPDTGWIMETEIWPGLFAACHDRGVRLTIINARLSGKSRDPSNRLVRSLYRSALNRVDVLARGHDDAAAFVRLGASPDRVSSVGNLKFAVRKFSSSEEDAHRLARRPIERPYCLAASTHADEERQLAELWLQACHDELLILVPRHPERGPALRREFRSLSGGQRIGLRSHAELPEAGDRLYLADTLGELPLWYRHAHAVFVGGSLIKHGGQNMLEPIREGKAVVVGPHTHNFPDVMAELRRSHVILETDSASGVVDFLLAAYHGDTTIDEQGQRALALSTQLNSATLVDAYLDRLLGSDPSAR